MATVNTQLIFYTSDWDLADKLTDGKLATVTHRHVAKG